MGFQIGKRPRIGPLGTVGGLPTPAYTAATKTASGKGADAGATVTVKVDGTTAGTATADSAGAWSYVFGTAPAAGAKITATAAVTSKAGVVPSAAPVLGTLSLSPSSGTVNTAFSATISGQTSGSTITLSGAGAAGLSVSGSTVSGTPTATGAIDLVETLSGATGSPKTTAGAATISVAQALRIVGNLTRANYAADTTSAGNEVREQRAPAYLGRQDCTEIWLVFCNWWLDLGAGGNETLTGNAVKLTMGLEYNGVTVLAPNASLASPAIVENGGTFEAGPFKPSDFGVAAFPAQAQILTRTRCEVAVGERIPRAGQVSSSSPASRKWRASGDASQIGNTGAFTDAVNTNIGPICNMVVGKTVANELAVLEIGDSIGEGNSDAQDVLVGQGYFDRAFAAVSSKRVPLAHMGRHGGTSIRFTLAGQDRRTALAKYASHVFIEFGANDLFQATDYVNKYRNNITTLISKLKAVNSAVKVIAVTVAPRTQSNDKFMTAAGQIDQNAWDNTVVKVQNDWLFSLKTDGTLFDVFDVNAAWGDAGGNAKWKVNGAAYYPIPAVGEGAGSVQAAGTGTITAATNSTTVTGSGTAFTTEAAVGSFIYSGGNYVGRVASVQSATSLTLEANATNARPAGSSFIVAERQIGTHPGPALNILAGTALASYVEGLTV